MESSGSERFQYFAQSYKVSFWSNQDSHLDWLLLHTNSHRPTYESGGPSPKGTPSSTTGNPQWGAWQHTRKPPLPGAWRLTLLLYSQHTEPAWTGEWKPWWIPLTATITPCPGWPSDTPPSTAFPETRSVHQYVSKPRTMYKGSSPLRPHSSLHTWEGNNREELHSTAAAERKKTLQVHRVSGGRA